MAKTIQQIELLSQLSLLERDGFDLASTWKSTAAAAADGDASKANDVLVLGACTHDLIRTVKALVARMARSGFEAEDAGFGRCLALLCAVAEMSVHYAETVEAARRVAGLMREVRAARGFH
ncbi:hypothetical protein ACWJKU_17215 [Methylocaldum sp. MU1018]